MNLSLTASQSIEWVTRILSVYFIFDSIGKIASYRNFLKDGFFGKNLLKTGHLYTARQWLMQNLLDVVLDFRIWLVLNLARLGGGLLLFLQPQQSILTAVNLCLLTVSASIINLYTRPFSPETDNRFALQITGALFLNSLVPTPFINEVCLWFIALQSCVSYATAGISKLFQTDWRKGNGLYMILQSRLSIFSDRLVLVINQQKKVLSLVTWTAIAFDSLFPLVLMVGERYYLLFVAAGLCFHLFIAIFLRLGKFFWVWVSTYPAIIYIAIKLHS